MRIALVLLAGCWTANAPPVVENRTAAAKRPAVDEELPGRRVVIEHEFLRKPISVRSDDENPDVATATNSVMLTVIPIHAGDGAKLMLSADGQPVTSAIGEVATDHTIDGEGKDERIAWRIEKAPDGALSLRAVNFATHVYCHIYEPEHPTNVQLTAAIAHCRDIRLAREGEAP